MPNIYIILLTQFLILTITILTSIRISPKKFFVSYCIEFTDDSVLVKSCIYEGQLKTEKDFVVLLEYLKTKVNEEDKTLKNLTVLNYQAI